MGAIIAVVSRKDEDQTQTAVSMLKAVKAKNIESCGTASPDTIRIEKNVDALQKQEFGSPIIIGQVFSRILKKDRPQPTKLKNATLVFEGRIYPLSQEMPDTEKIALRLQNQNLEKSVENLIKEAEGDYAIAVAESERLIVCRSVMGIYPLYYGKNESLAAVASERKALWKIGIEKVASFPPGQIAIVNKDGFKFRPVKTLIYSKPSKTVMQHAAKKLQTLLEQSVKQKVAGLKECAVAFSGGLDSSVIALLTKNSRVDAHLIHVSLEGQSETEHARKVAEGLKLPLQTYIFTSDQVKRLLPKVLWLIEESDAVKASVGIPIYFAAKKAAEMGLKIMLAGQGADELFGGYKRYVDNYLQYGSEKAKKMMFNDTIRMYEANFERDVKICNFHNVELRLPFATYEIAQFAIDLPLTLKIDRHCRTLRKLVLRKMAENLGLSEFVVKRPKKAMQYATGTNRILTKLARSEGLSVKEYLEKTSQLLIRKNDLQ